MNAVDLVHAVTALLECGTKKGPIGTIDDHVDKFWCASLWCTAQACLLDMHLGLRPLRQGPVARPNTRFFAPADSVPVLLPAAGVPTMR